MLVRVAVPTIPAEEEKDQEPTPPGHVPLPWRTRGSGWAGGAERDGAAPPEKPTVRHGKDPDSPRLQLPLPLQPAELRPLPSALGPYHLSSRFAYLLILA